MSAARHAGSAAAMRGEAKRSLLERRATLAAGGEAARQELVEIDAALARIEAGNWGHCERCGSAIGRDRLRALPEIRRCLSCSAA